MAKVQIDQVKGAEERNEMNVQRVVTALLHSHIDELALRNLPVDAVMEDAIIQLKETALQILRLADDIHRVHSGLGNSPVCPVPPLGHTISDNVLRDTIEMALLFHGYIKVGPQAGL
mgnify:FL=1